MRFNLPIAIGTLILFVAIVAAALLGYLLSQLIRGFLPVDALTFSLTLFLLVMVVGLIYVLLELVRRQQLPPAPQVAKFEPIERSLEEPIVRHREVISQPPDSEFGTALDPIERSLEEPMVRQREVPFQPSQNLSNSELQSRLINMLGGDRAAAERLVSDAKQSHPGMPENWYWERAIEDLERDRR